MTIEQQFEQFRMRYPSVRVRVLLKEHGDEDDLMIYKTPMVKESIKRANALIRELGLGLIAKEVTANNVFVVELKK